jgi:MFS family permease
MFTKVDIEKYFVAEKNLGLIAAVVGIAAALVAIYFTWFQNQNSFLKGIAIPLTVIGIFYCIAGYTVYKRSDGQRISNVYNYDLGPNALKNEELPRMQKVMKNFVVLRYAEVTLALLGIGLFLYFRSNDNRQWWAGLGMGLAIMAALALVADYFAEQRGHVYTKGLTEFTKDF